MPGPAPPFERSYRAGVVQLCSRGDTRRNLARIRELVAEAVAQGAELVALPENFAWLRIPGAEPAPVGPVPGPLVDEMAQLARAHGIYLLCGGLPEGDPAEPRYYQASVLLAPDGSLAAHYRKRHLFDVELPDGTILRESEVLKAGDDLVCAETPLGNIGFAICYDLRFPEHFRALVDAGAHILTVPSAFTDPTGRAHWHVLLRARAIENQCYVIAPGQVGVHGGDRHSYGHSLIVDPWGEVLAEVEEGEGVAVAEIDPHRLATIREKIPALKHRR